MNKRDIPWGKIPSLDREVKVASYHFNPPWFTANLLVGDPNRIVYYVDRQKGERLEEFPFSPGTSIIVDIGIPLLAVVTEREYVKFRLPPNERWQEWDRFCCIYTLEWGDGSEA